MKLLPLPAPTQWLPTAVDADAEVDDDTNDAADDDDEEDDEDELA